MGRRLTIVAMAVAIAVWYGGAASAAGLKWVIQPTPDPSMNSALVAVSCASATSCTAVGQYLNTAGRTFTLAEHWNGSSWTVQDTPNPAGSSDRILAAVSCASPASCTAAGSYTSSSGESRTLAEHWNGHTWAIQATVRPPGAAAAFLGGVSCTSAASCTAVGDYDTSAGITLTLAERWNGRSWAIQPTPSRPGSTATFLSGVSCVSAASCAAAGQYADSSGNSQTLAEHWNGRAWAVQRTPAPSGPADNHFLDAISCVSAASCTASGSSFSSSSGHEVPLAEHWNGRSWAIQPTPSPSGSPDTFLSGISCASAASCTASGQYTSSSGREMFTLAEHWDGHSWTIQPTPDPPGSHFSSLAGVWCATPASCTAAGQYTASSGAELTLAEHQ